LKHSVLASGILALSLAAAVAGPASAQIVLPPAQQGVAYSEQLTTPFLYFSTSYSATTLPAGLTIQGSTLSGTPTASGLQQFDVSVTGFVTSTCYIPNPGGGPSIPMPCPQAASTVQTYQLQVAPSAAASIPTMSEWAMILLGLALAGGAALFIQRRRLEA